MIRLSTRQQEALPLLVTYPGLILTVAGKQGSPGRLFTSRLKNPAFKAELTKRREILVTDALDMMKAHMGKAVDTLVSLLKAESESVRRQAANDIYPTF